MRNNNGIYIKLIKESNKRYQLLCNSIQYINKQRNVMCVEQNEPAKFIYTRIQIVIFCFFLFLKNLKSESIEKFNSNWYCDALCSMILFRFTCFCCVMHTNRLYIKKKNAVHCFLYERTTFQWYNKSMTDIHRNTR